MFINLLSIFSIPILFSHFSSQPNALLVFCILMIFSPIHLEGNDAHLKTTIPTYFILYIGYLLLDFLYV